MSYETMFMWVLIAMSIVFIVMPLLVMPLLVTVVFNPRGSYYLELVKAGLVLITVILSCCLVATIIHLIDLFILGDLEPITTTLNHLKTL